MHEIVFVSRAARTFFKAPVDICRADKAQDVPACMAQVRRGLDAGLYAAGFLCYEAAPAFDAALAVYPAGPLPAAWFGLYRAPENDCDWSGPGDFRVGTWRPGATRRRYDRCIRAIRELIAAGDVYQVNYTFPLEASFNGDSAAWFRRLYARQPADHGVYARLDRFSIASVSPELFFRLQNGRLETRPMKGTRPRHTDAAADRRAARELRAAPKEQAENVMIVDLLRNDMSRICRPGSVKVTALYSVEAYPTVWQMTSTVTGRTAATAPDTLAALFPSGSVTGAPKVRAMQVIRELEQCPRGLYCGSLGWMAPDGRAEFNVAIRTAVIDHVRRRAWYHVGGGITHDSQVADEYAECLAKAAVLHV